MELDATLSDEIKDLRRLLISEATTPSEKALLLIALEVAEMRATLALLVTSSTIVDRTTQSQPEGEIGLCPTPFWSTSAG